MHMKNSSNTLLTYAAGLLLLSLISTSSEASTYPKREMRSTWLTTVRNVDWPVQGAGAVSQKQDLIRMLDSLHTLNLNTVAFQVRCNADAFYQSAYEPWSALLTGTRGKDPGFDPLQFCIDECHKRGMACHAWLNPYRYNNKKALWNDGCETGYEYTHPEWLFVAPNDACVVMDPGLPEVRMRVKEVVGDILGKYDVDGIIFDDYFYPYGGTGSQDIASQQLYKPADMNVGDWRRQNVLEMVQDVYDTIQAVKPYVTFGISPFGIWTTDWSVAWAEDVNLPRGISGGNMYAEIYCDPVSWLKAGVVDYISPQLYWTTQHTGQKYDVLCKWWADLANRFGVHFYSSMSLDSYSRGVANYTLQEMRKQMNFNRTSGTDDAFGFIYFNTKAYCYKDEFRTNFKKIILHYPALQPAINWKAVPERQMVDNLQVSGSTVTWTHPDSDVRFVVYAVPVASRNDTAVFSVGESLLGQTYTCSYTLPAGVTTATHKIGVSVLDRYNNEYALRIFDEPLGTPEATVLSKPSNGATKALPFTFRWQSVQDADSYIIQFARDEAFQDIVFAQEVTGTTFDSANRINLKYLPHGTYWWRVKTRIPNAGDTWSEAFAVNLSDTDALEEIHPQTAAVQGIYTVLGVPVADTDNLPHGVYVMAGKKIIK